MRVRSAVTAVSALAFVGGIGLAGPAAAAPADPGCQGRIVALFNSESGVFGPSANPSAAAGPGVFLRTETSTAVRGVQEAFCP